MKFSIQWKRILVLAFGISCLSSCNVPDMGRHQIYESVSPAKLGSAIFDQNQGLDTIIRFCIRDNKVGAKVIDMGIVSDSGGQGTWPEDIVWSRDGTVIGIRTDDTIQTPKGQWIQRGVLFTHFYDFRRNSGDFLADLSLKQRSDTIKVLINNRGGEGKKVKSNWDYVGPLRSKDDSPR